MEVVQALESFGPRSKDGSLDEFFPIGRGEVLLREYSLAPSSLRDCSPRLLGYFHFYFL